MLKHAHRIHTMNKQQQSDAALQSLTNEFKELRIENQKLKEELHVQASWRPSPNTASAPAGPSARPPASTNPLVFELPALATSLIPPRERKEASMGNIGWDTSRDTLLIRCREILQEANVDPSSHNAPYVERNFGSVASVVFKSASERVEAERKVRGLHKIVPEFAVHPKANHERPFVWMGPTKTGDELLTGRILGQLNTAIKDMESRLSQEVAQGWEVVGGPLFSEWKLCKGDQRHSLVSVTSSQIRWTLFAQQRYGSLEDLRLVSEWAYTRCARRQ